MTMTTIAPGTLWLERRPDYPDGWRRVVEVQSVDDADIPGANGFVHAVGWWQQRDGDRWQDTPETSRKTRVRTVLFARRYELIAAGLNRVGEEQR
jgi:hypothetical protein